MVKERGGEEKDCERWMLGGEIWMWRSARLMWKCER